VPEAVVYELRDRGYERIPEVHDLPVHREGFERPVCGVEYGAAGGFVNAARLHSDEPVLYEVHAAHAVRLADFVQRTQELGGLHGLPVDLRRNAALEIYVYVYGLVRGLFRGHRELEHIVRGLRPRVFENAALIAYVK